MATLLLGETSAFSQDAKIPKLFKRATDFTNTLSAQDLNSLEADLARFEDSTSTQLTVVMIPTVGGESVEDFALRTAELNGIGQKKRDNGVLLLIAKDDRTMRIEVGYGLEGVLPDGLAGTIIRREITPHFRNDDYYAGIKAGVDAIILATRNEYSADKRQSDEFGGVPIIFLLFFLFVLFLVMRRGRGSAGLPAAAGLPMFFGGGAGSRPIRSSSGWGGGGGGSFGGFSGGGGSFGGGGASGSW